MPYCLVQVLEGMLPASPELKGKPEELCVQMQALPYVGPASAGFLWTMSGQLAPQPCGQ
jgi:hypothetical protein